MLNLQSIHKMYRLACRASIFIKHKDPIVYQYGFLKIVQHCCVNLLQHFIMPLCSRNISSSVEISRGGARTKNKAGSLH